MDHMMGGADDTMNGFSMGPAGAMGMLQHDTYNQ